MRVIHTATKMITTHLNRVNQYTGTVQCRQHPATPQERVEAKESSILDAAEKIFGRVGFDGAKVSEIARAASVAEGTVYLYYKNKQDLLAGVVGRFWTQLTLGAEAAIEPDVTTATAGAVGPLPPQLYLTNSKSSR